MQISGKMNTSLLYAELLRNGRTLLMWLIGLLILEHNISIPRMAAVCL